MAAILIALGLQTTLSSQGWSNGAALDLVLIVVVYVAIKSGPSTGLLAGTVAGLIQDSLSSGILGIGGLAKTLVGFLSGVLGSQFIVTAPLPRFLLLLMATALHAAIFMGLYTLLDLRQFPAPYSSVLRAGLRQRVRRRGGVPDHRVVPGLRRPTSRGAVFEAIITVWPLPKIGAS